MGRNLAFAVLLCGFVLSTACCSTSGQAVDDPNSPAVATAGWESPEAGTATIPDPEPVALKDASGTADDVTSLREANRELMDEVGRLTEEVRAMRTERAAPAPAPAPVPPTPAVAPAPARPVLSVETIRSALRSAGASELTVSRSDRDLITVTLHGQGSFGPGKANLSADAKATLDKLVRVLKRDLADARLRIEGHTDSDPIRKSNWESNEALSAARAAAVADYLTRTGEISRSRVESIGYGATRPIASNATRDGKAQNRRVEIVILP
jgi:flagellar motor protein MotB